MSLVFFYHLSFTLALEAFSSLNYDCTDSLYCGFDCIEFFDIHELTKGVDLLFDCNITFVVLLVGVAFLFMLVGGPKCTSFCLMFAIVRLFCSFCLALPKTERWHTSDSKQFILCSQMVTY